MFAKKTKNPRQEITKTTAKVHDCQTALRNEKRQLDRHIYATKESENQAKKTIGQLARKGMNDKCHDILISIMASRRSAKRLESAKLHIDIVTNQLEQLRSEMRLSGAIQTSTEVADGMAALVKVPEISKTMTKMAKEMYKLGIITEKLNKNVATDCEVNKDDEVEEEETLKRLMSELNLAGLTTRSVSVDSSPTGNKPAIKNDTHRSMSAVETTGLKTSKSVRSEAMLA